MAIEKQKSKNGDYKYRYRCYDCTNGMKEIRPTLAAANKDKELHENSKQHKAIITKKKK